MDLRLWETSTTWSWPKKGVKYNLILGGKASKLACAILIIPFCNILFQGFVKMNVMLLCNIFVHVTLQSMAKMHEISGKERIEEDVVFICILLI